MPAFSDFPETLQRLTRNRWRQVVFHLIFLFPMLGAVISKLSRHRHLLNDYDALACGAWSLAHHVSPYSRHPVCPGLDPAPFVYAPQVGQGFIPFINLFGLEPSRLAWLVIVVPAMLFLTWFALLRVMPRAPYALRLMTLAAVAGSAVTCGNIGFVLNAAVIACALILRRSRLPFIALVVLSALIKPVMLTYLFVLLCDDRPLRSRLTAVVPSAIAGLAGVAAIFATAGPLSGDWHALMTFILGQQPGVGFLSYTSLIGLPASSPATMALLAIFLAAIGLSGFILVEWGGLSRDERIVLGIGIAQLLNPRLMDYDMLGLAPFAALLVMMSRSFGDRLYARFGWIFAATLIGCVITNLLEVPVLHRSPVTVFVYCTMTVWLGVVVASRYRAAIRLKIVRTINKVFYASPSNTSAS